MRGCEKTRATFRPAAPRCIEPARAPASCDTPSLADKQPSSVVSVVITVHTRPLPPLCATHARSSPWREKSAAAVILARLACWIENAGARSARGAACGHLIPGETFARRVILRTRAAGRIIPSTFCTHQCICTPAIRKTPNAFAAADNTSVGRRGQAGRSVSRARAPPSVRQRSPPRFRGRRTHATT